MLSHETEKPSVKSWLERQQIQNEDSDSPFFSAEKQQGVTSIMLDFEFENGNRLALPYSGILKIDYNPSDGILLEWVNEHVRITGYNLGELYNLLVRHRVNSIRESKDDFDIQRDGKLVIRQIARER